MPGMEIIFKHKNGCCPEFIYNGMKFYLLEEPDVFNEIKWVLLSRKAGFSKRTPKVNPYALLRRFFEDKRYRLVEKRHYRFYYWKGMQIATDGEIITIRHDYRHERPYFSNYIDCLNDAKAYIKEEYMDKQLTLFDLM